MVKIAVLEVKQRLFKPKDVVIMDKYRLRKRRDGVSEILGYVCTN